MLSELQKRILRTLVFLGDRESEWVRMHLGNELGRQIAAHEFAGAVDGLVQLQHLARVGVLLRRREPDCAERKLYPAIEAFLGSSAGLQLLNLDAQAVTLHCTAVGGRRSGIWSAPDFTAATIRSFEYDPRRYLDVLTFEVKNRRGTNVPAAHEALAHGRFAHLPYLVCPRTRIDDAANEEMTRTCAQLGVGLILFDLDLQDDGVPVVSAIAVAAEPTRREPDPRQTANFLTRMFTPDKLSELRLRARG